MPNINPLDLFSDQPTTSRDYIPTRDNDSSPSETEEAQGIPTHSSPVQTEETFLLDKYQRLLQLRNELKNEVRDLEVKWNEKDMKQKGELEKRKEEEADLVLKLLLQQEDEDQDNINENGNGNEEEVDSEIDDSDIDSQEDEYQEDQEEKITFDPSEYDATPLRDWSLRITYLKKLYPYLKITEYDSRLSLDYENNGRTVKIISFRVAYDDVITVRVKLDLDQNQEIINSKDGQLNEYYSLRLLSIEKVSNNALNSILTKLIKHYGSQNDLNEFLYQLNDLYELIIRRFGLISSLSQEFNNIKLSKRQIFIDEFNHKLPNSETVSIVWNLRYDSLKNSFETLINSNLHNHLLLKLTQAYGEEEGTNKFLRVLIDGL